MNVFFARGRAAMEVSPFGDRALVLTITSERQAPAWRVMAEAGAVLSAAGLPWVVDVVPAYETVTVIYDPLGADPTGKEAYAAASAAVADVLAGGKGAESSLAGVVGEPRVVEIPVCYGGAFGPDLAECAERSRRTPAAFVAAHAEARYEVAVVGFMPGFPYLTGLPAALGQPRLALPRRHVPAGSVGIAGGQTGVYPLDSPGGWQLIGRTPLRLFRPERGDEPVRFRAGDCVRFVPVDEQVFAEIAAAESAYRQSEEEVERC